MAKRKAKAKKTAKKKVRLKTAKKKQPKNLATRARAELKRNPKSQKKVARKLTAQQILFVDCYLGAAKRTATRAAIMAGYSDKTGSQASTLMANPKVRSYLKRRQDDLRRRLEVTQEKVAAEMAAVAFSKPTDFLRWRKGKLVVFDSDEIPDDMVGSIKSMKPLFDKDGNPLGLEIKFHDKIAAAKLLAQHLGMLEVRASMASKGTIIEAMELIHAEAVKLGKGEK